MNENLRTEGVLIKFSKAEKRELNLYAEKHWMKKVDVIRKGLDRLYQEDKQQA